MSTKPLEEKIDISSLSDEQFDLNISITKAKEIINEIGDRWCGGSFDDDCWVISRLDYTSNTNSFDFNKFDSSSFSNTLPREFKNMVKCWIIELINKYKKVAVYYFIDLVKAFNISKGFRVEEKENLIKYIEQSELTLRSKRGIINALFNFFDYTDLKISEVYVPSLLNLYNKLPNQQNIRILPPTQDIMSFSYYLEKDFKDLLESPLQQKEYEKEILSIYPLVIWWRLTNLIPIRPTEFCLIKRDCIHTIGKKHYIKLPRRKLNSKRIQILDKILVDEEMHELIEYYQKITEKFGETETLISYRSLVFASSPTSRGHTKKNLNQFSIQALDSLIRKFYKVMLLKYQCDIQKENYIKPNDTRHLAFVSLMMQGYSPVEIARLGGHQTISSQYHYSGHTEFWADYEVFKLMTKAKHSQIGTNNLATIPREVKLKAYDDRTEFSKKLKIGYCKDKEQRCESRQCYFCSHWGISPKEIIKKEDKIRRQMLHKRNKINELTAVIKNLNKLVLKDDVSRKDKNLLTNLKTNANAVQYEIQGLAKFCLTLEEGVLNNE
ncbi:site-specific integrase [Priestia aryabhattai]